MDQYNCRSNIEVSGVSEVVSGKNLEKTEKNIFYIIDVKISNSDVETVIVLHQEKNAIVRFTNRKHCLSALRNRKKLMSIDYKEKNFPGSGFFIGKNLTPMNSKIDFICQE